MTIALPLRSSRATWASVESGFYVASRDGEFVGSVEKTADGHFVGFDGRSTPVGHYTDLNDAQRAVEDAPENVEKPLSTRTEAILQTAATVAGVVAIGTLVTAVAALPGI